MKEEENREQKEGYGRKGAIGREEKEKTIGSQEESSGER